MSNITINMSPLEPSTIQKSSTSLPAITEDGIIIFMVPKYKNRGNLQYLVDLRENFENSIYGVLRGSILSDPVWERSTYQTQQFGSSVTKTKDSITITVQNPTGRIEGIPYWYMTRIDARNPQNVSPHYPFIVSYGKQEPEAITPQEGETWLYELPNSFVHEETQPKPVPGEYIRVIWGLLVNEKYFEAIRSVKYETPLLTGGWILSKEGEDENVTYTVEIYGVTVSGIKPTDYFDYTGGLSSQRWVYLMKMNVTLNDGKQVYGSSNIKNVQDSEYRIVPLNLYGPMNSSCAVPYEDAIKIDSAINFSKVFDMTRYEGEVISVDTDNDEVEVDIPGASVHILPVFYYCKDSDTIVGGSAAFTAGDTCIIEKPNPNSWEDAYVIGFPDEIKPCTSLFLKITAGSEILIYNLDADKIADNIPKDDGTGYATFPCADVGIIDNWLSDKSETGGDAVQRAYYISKYTPTEFYNLPTTTFCTDTYGGPCAITECDWHPVDTSTCKYDYYSLQNWSVMDNIEMEITIDAVLWVKNRGEETQILQSQSRVSDTLKYRRIDRTETRQDHHLVLTHVFFEEDWYGCTSEPEITHGTMKEHDFDDIAIKYELFNPFNDLATEVIINTEKVTSVDWGSSSYEDTTFCEIYEDIRSLVAGFEFATCMGRESDAVINPFMVALTRETFTEKILYRECGEVILSSANPMQCPDISACTKDWEVTYEEVISEIRKAFIGISTTDYGEDLDPFNDLVEDATLTSALELFADTSTNFTVKFIV